MVHPRLTEQQAPMVQALVGEQLVPHPAKVWPEGHGSLSSVHANVVLLQQAATFRLQTSLGAQEVPTPAQALLFVLP